MAPALFWTLVLHLGSAWAAPLTVAVLGFESKDVSAEQAAATSALVAAHLAEVRGLKVISQADVQAVLTAERQRQLLGGCEAESCFTEVGSLTGARYVVAGRVDRFGTRLVVTASLVDTVEGRSLVKPHAEVDDEGTLPEASRRIAEELARAMPRDPGDFEAVPFVGLRFNNTFFSNLAALNPGGDVELGLRFHPEWAGFLQVGMSYVRSHEPGRSGGVNVLPTVVGARHYSRVAHRLQPYWGVGLGLQLAFGHFGIFRETGPLPTLVGFLGVDYAVGRRLALQLEAGTNVTEAILGLAGDRLGKGLNFDLSAGVAYRF